jgi:hypothetical protein
MLYSWVPVCRALCNISFKIRAMMVDTSVICSLTVLDIPMHRLSVPFQSNLDPSRVLPIARVTLFDLLRRGRKGACSTRADFAFGFPASRDPPRVRSRDPKSYTPWRCGNSGATRGISAGSLGVRWWSLPWHQSRLGRSNAICVEVKVQST